MCAAHAARCQTIRQCGWCHRPQLALARCHHSVSGHQPIDARSRVFHVVFGLLVVTLVHLHMDMLAGVREPLVALRTEQLTVFHAVSYRNTDWIQMQDARPIRRLCDRRYLRHQTGRHQHGLHSLQQAKAHQRRERWHHLAGSGYLQARNPWSRASDPRPERWKIRRQFYVSPAPEFPRQSHPKTGYAGFRH